MQSIGVFAFSKWWFKKVSVLAILIEIAAYNFQLYINTKNTYFFSTKIIWTDIKKFSMNIAFLRFNITKKNN